MKEVFLYSILSVLLISLVAFIGIFSIGIRTNKLKKILIYLVSFSAGALFGDVFIHIFPEISGQIGFGLKAGAFVLFGIFLFFILEKIICWQHCHMPITKKHVHSFAYMNLVGDGIHNFIDGLIIGTSYIISIPLGLATTLAVFLHEIPQEIGDFGVLMHGGFSKSKALFTNFLTALTAILGTIFAFLFYSKIESFAVYLLAFAAGGFIYIAGSDLIPELHKESEFKKSFLQILAFLSGIFMMLLILLIEF